MIITLVVAVAYNMWEWLFIIYCVRCIEYNKNGHTQVFNKIKVLILLIEHIPSEICCIRRCRNLLYEHIQYLNISWTVY